MKKWIEFYTRDAWHYAGVQIVVNTTDQTVTVQRVIFVARAHHYGAMAIVKKLPPLHDHCEHRMVDPDEIDWSCFNPSVTNREDKLHQCMAMAATYIVKNGLTGHGKPWIISKHTGK